MLWRCTFRLDQPPLIYHLQSLPRWSSSPSIIGTDHTKQRGLFFVLFSFFFCWTDSPAGCHHSAQRSWLIICQAPWGMRPVCQQQAQCFSEQRWRLERARAIQPLCGQEGRKTSEAARTKGGKGEREREKWASIKDWKLHKTVLQMDVYCGSCQSFWRVESLLYACVAADSPVTIPPMDHVTWSLQAKAVSLWLNG